MDFKLPTDLNLKDIDFKVPEVKKIAAIPEAAKETPEPLGQGDEAQAKTFQFPKYVVAPPTELNNLNANPFSLVTTLRDNLGYAVSSLMKGRDCRGKNLTLGNRFFVASGTCDRKESVPQCRGKTRYFYVDNVPKAVLPCMDTTRPYDPNCDQGGTGLMNGMISDILHLNPFELMMSSAGNGSIINNKCVRRTEKVGFESGDDKQYHYETRCAPERQPLICSLKSKKVKCRVHTKNYDAERRINGRVIEIIGGPLCILYTHTSSKWLEELRAHSYTREKRLRRDGVELPRKKMHWIVIGTLRKGEIVYAQYDDIGKCYVSDIGFTLLGDRRSLANFKSTFYEIMQCKHKRDTDPSNACPESTMIAKYKKINALVTPVLITRGILHTDHSNTALETFLQSIVDVFTKRDIGLSQVAELMGSNDPSEDNFLTMKTSIEYAGLQNGFVPLAQEPDVLNDSQLDKFDLNWRRIVTNVHRVMNNCWDLECI